MDILDMQIKFFPRDVIGKQPKQVGDKFKARFFGKIYNFKISIHGGDWFMATLVV